jgi:hypothetical protein
VSQAKFQPANSRKTSIRIVSVPVKIRTGKFTKNFNQDSRCPGRNLNRQIHENFNKGSRCPKFEPGVYSIQSKHCPLSALPALHTVTIRYRTISTFTVVQTSNLISLMRLSIHLLLTRLRNIIEYCHLLRVIILHLQHTNSRGL